MRAARLQELEEMAAIVFSVRTSSLDQPRRKTFFLLANFDSFFESPFPPTRPVGPPFPHEGSALRPSGRRFHRPDYATTPSPASLADVAFSALPQQCGFAGAKVRVRKSYTSWRQPSHRGYVGPDTPATHRQPHSMKAVRPVASRLELRFDHRLGAAHL
jgi:hypothetical protein